MTDTEPYSILVLSKRQYTGRDLLDDKFGRIWELPLSLAHLGNHVSGVCISYRPKSDNSIEYVTDSNNNRVHWQSLNILNLFPWWKSRYLQTIDAIGKQKKPDVIWACSDAIHAIIGMFISKRLGVPLVIDLYDNFESFGLTNIPGMKKLLKSACRTANGLTPVSKMLDNFITKRYGLVSTPRLVLNNAIDKNVFHTRPKHILRKELGLPPNAKLIGTAGALTKDRGIETLLKAFVNISNDNQDVWLVVAGPRDKTVSNFRHDRFIDMGTLNQEKVAELYSTLDLAVICNIDSDFGRYCFPQKFYEIIACGTPAVAANVGEMKRLLKSHPDRLFTPGSVNDLVRCINKQLEAPSPITDIPIPSWTDQAERLDGLIRSVIDANKHR